MAGVEVDKPPSFDITNHIIQRRTSMGIEDSLKITAIKPFLVRPISSNPNWIIQKHWLFVKVETDQGMEGWGEAFTMKYRERNIAHYVNELSPFLLGSNPFHIKAFTQMAMNRFAERRPGLDLLCAVSGIEQALWDIVGKSLGVPVYALLGGPLRNRVKVYANGFSRGADTPEKMAQRALEVVRLGFTALKFYPFLQSEDEDLAVETVRAVREAVGPKIDILIDIWRRPSPTQAIRFARRIEPFGIFCYEEPVSSENLDVLAEVRRSIHLPVVAGECLYTKPEFRALLEKRAVDILNPDVASCGGILELKEIAAMAEPYAVLIAPHNWNSTAVALAATIQVAATLPHFLTVEYFVSFAETGNAICRNPFQIENGHIALPTGPGLGLEIIEAALKKYPFQEYAST
jgi:galactonate dehydratase